jgi:hypothetical protein
MNTSFPIIPFSNGIYPLQLKAKNRIPIEIPQVKRLIFRFEKLVFNHQLSMLSTYVVFLIKSELWRLATRRHALEENTHLKQPN